MIAGVDAWAPVKTIHCTMPVPLPVSDNPKAESSQLSWTFDLGVAKLSPIHGYIKVDLFGVRYLVYPTVLKRVELW